MTEGEIFQKKTFAHLEQLKMQLNVEYLREGGMYTAQVCSNKVSVHSEPSSLQ